MIILDSLAKTVLKERRKRGRVIGQVFRFKLSLLKDLIKPGMGKVFDLWATLGSRQRDGVCWRLTS